MSESIPMFIVVEIETSGGNDTAKALERLEKLILEAEIPMAQTKGHLFIRGAADRIREVIDEIFDQDFPAPITEREYPK